MGDLQKSKAYFQKSKLYFFQKMPEHEFLFLSFIFTIWRLKGFKVPEDL
jgi:hypothetical protein